MRKPLLEAWAAASVAYVSNNRLAVGIGLARMAEEFKWLKENKKTRGVRVDEAIQIIRLCTSGGGLANFTLDSGEKLEVRYRGRSLRL